ncbi:hypothetical protein ACFCW6_13615 [Streptomyces sp. NPDC056333]|uniref:hypothetical protein n=1 Tax=Streptomyces sp. NPDC056333 TaxID=3345786 RepID=UPI0035E1D264
MDSGLDGTAAAASSSKRHRRILNVATEYAVMNRFLRSNLLPKGRGTTLKTSSAVDPRPEEVVAMRVLDARLPGEHDDDQWGELLFHTAQPEVGKQWTDTGEVQEKRGLKGRTTDDPTGKTSTRIRQSHPQKPGDSRTAPDVPRRDLGSVRRLCVLYVALATVL